MQCIPFPPGPDGAAPAEFHRLLSDFPVSRVRLPDGSEVWLVVRHEDVRRVLTDPAFSRRQAALSPGVGYGRNQQTGLLDLDPPEHERLRRPVDEALCPERVSRARPMLRQTVRELLDEVEAAGEPAELVADFAAPLAGRTICELVGLPVESWWPVTGWLDLRVSPGAPPEEAAHAGAAIDSLLDELIAERRAQPADDIASVLLAGTAERQPLTDDEARQVLAGLLVSGYIGDRNALARHIFALLARPGAWQELRSMRTRLSTAVEELLRCYPSSNDGLVRVALQDVWLRGRLIRAGETVMPLVAAAALDESVFAEPQRLDLSRSPNPHLALGAGPHACPGAQLVRAIFGIALDGLAERFPDLRLAVPPQQLVHTTTLLPLGIERLPVRWGAAD